MFTHQALGVLDAVAGDHRGEFLPGQTVQDSTYVCLVGRQFGGDVGDAQILAERGKTIYNDIRFKEESNKLISINKENNCIIKYYYNTIFDLPDDGYNPNPDLDIDDVFDQ